MALDNALEKIKENELNIEEIVDNKVKDVVFQDRLLHAVNEVATLLLGSDSNTFDETLFACMDKIGTPLTVDRVYIWKNHYEGEELYCSQIYEWSGGAEPQQGNELTISVPFPGDWFSRLSANKCVNGIVSTFPERERTHLEAQGIISILVVPVFLHNEFWGFVGFDDCRAERFFSDAEEAILRSVSLLFATSLLRNEMTLSLVNAKEAALSSARAKTDFLATMSHEIRTPINAITGMSRIARMAQDKQAVDGCLNSIDAASKQLLSLVSDILDMSKIDAGKLVLASAPFALDVVLRDVASIISVRASEKDQHFSVSRDPALPAVLVGDAMRLSQLLLNLLSNAVKFTPIGGRICLTAALEGNLPDGMVRLAFSVRDSGIGIPSEKIDRLFIKFEQMDRGTSRQFGGAGLGLAISHSIAELMQGDITVESEPGAGSCFTASLVFPVGDESMLAVDDAEEIPDHDFSGRTALLVEDIDINREIVVTLLETGLAIDEAENGQAALEMFRADPGRYDIIFMDIHMPIKDGYETTREIRALDHPRGRAVPIIAMTANAFTEDVQNCLDAGMNDHLAKPINFDALVRKLTHYFTPE